MLAPDRVHISALLDQHAHSDSQLILYTEDDLSSPTYLKYSQLRQIATKKARLLRQYLGVSSDKLLLIYFKTHLENITWFWTCVFAGFVPVLSPPVVSDIKGRHLHFRHLHRLLNNPVVITNQELCRTDFAENQNLRVVTVDAIESYSQFESISETQPAEDDTFRINSERDPVDSDVSDGDEASLSSSVSSRYSAPSEDLAVLMLTSGSTGNAKAVCLSHRQILASLKGKLTSMPLPHKSTVLSWIALDHVANLTEIHLCAMLAGLDQIQVPATVMLESPLFFLRLLSKHRVSRTFAPDFFLHRLQTTLDASTAQDTQDIDLRYLLYINSGGEPNDVKTCARVTQQLHQLGASGKNIITPGFGMTETCAGAIFNRNVEDIDMRSGQKFASLGNCMPGIKMRVTPTVGARSSETLPANNTPFEGELELCGPVVFEKYFNDEVATKNVFTPDGWFKTGDLGTIDATGNLRLVGRSKEVVIVNGVKYLPHEIENAIDRAEILGVTPTFVACFGQSSSEFRGERIHIVYQHKYDTDDAKTRAEALQEIIRVVVLFTGARPYVLPLPSGTLEKTTLGKLSRAKIRTALESGQYEYEQHLDAQMLNSYQISQFGEPQNSIEQTLMRVFTQTLGLEQLNMSVNTPILDTGVSSVDLIRLKNATERALNIKEIPMIKIMTNTTVRALAAAIEHSSEDTSGEHKYDPVVTLQHNGPKTPLWLIHPGIGEVMVFLGLVRYFPDRPIYALRARGFNADETPFTDLTEVLRIYSQAIRKRQPRGPYAIAGYSYGSMLAFEIAKMFEADNEEVKFLGSFNLPPHIKERMRLLDWTAGLMHISFFCRIITEERSEELTNKLRGRPTEAQVEELLAEADPERCTELGLTQESLLKWTNVAFALQKIGWDYDPSGAVTSMDVFYCQPLKVVARTLEEYRNTKLNHWADFVRDDLRFHEVGGEHYTMIGPEHVSGFQQTLKDVLATRGL